MTPELEEVTFRRCQTAPGEGHEGGATPRRDHGPGGSSGTASRELWEFVAHGGEVFAWAEVFPAADQWGVRLQDRAPDVLDGDLLKLVGKLLIWDIGCPADTVDVVLGRTHDHHTLVRVGGEYV